MYWEPKVSKASSWKKIKKKKLNLNKKTKNPKSLWLPLNTFLFSLHRINHEEDEEIWWQRHLAFITCLFLNTVSWPCQDCILHFFTYFDVFGTYPGVSDECPCLTHVRHWYEKGWTMSVLPSGSTSRAMGSTSPFWV